MGPKFWISSIANCQVSESKHVKHGQYVVVLGTDIYLTISLLGVGTFYPSPDRFHGCLLFTSGMASYFRVITKTPVLFSLDRGHEIYASDATLPEGYRCTPQVGVPGTLLTVLSDFTEAAAYRYVGSTLKDQFLLCNNRTALGRNLPMTRRTA